MGNHVVWLIEPNGKELKLTVAAADSEADAINRFKAEISKTRPDLNLDDLQINTYVLK